MVKIKIVTMSGIKNIIADENKSVKEVLDEEEVSYAGRTLTLDGYNLSAGEIAQSLADLGVAERGVIGVTAKSENAAKATVIANAFVVTSALKLEDLKTVKKYRPEALTLYEGEGEDKEPVFAIAMTEADGGSINKYGATFGKMTDDEGHARLTMTLEDYEREDLIDKLGPAILKLNALEATLGAQLDGIAEDKAAATAAIDFA